MEGFFNFWLVRVLRLRYSPVDLLCGEVMQLSVAWLLDFGVSLVCCGFIFHAESLRKRFVPFVHLHALFLVGSVHQVLL